MLRLLLLLSLAGPASFGQEAEDKSGQRPIKISAEDLKEYLNLVRTRLPDVSDAAELEAMTRASFERIYLHQLRSNFHSKPSPRRVLEKIEGIFHEFDAAQQILRTLRGAKGPPASRKDMNHIMERLDRSARAIQGDFHEYFTELNQGSLNIQISDLGDGGQQWKFYLVRVDQCFSILNEQLQRYFFNSEPGRVAVQDFKNPGVVTVTRAIHELTRVYRERLKVR